MKKFWHRLLSTFTGFERGVHHVIVDFHNMIVELESIADSHRAEVDTIEAEFTRLAAERDIHLGEIVRAVSVAKQIDTIINPPQVQ
jgi:hypothetical protein